jgi:hypothetical protein
LVTTWPEAFESYPVNCLLRVKDVRANEASSLTAGTSHLASRYGIYRYVDCAIATGDRVLAENSGVTGRDAMGFWTVANNLAICTSLSRRINRLPERVTMAKR